MKRKILFLMAALLAACTQLMGATTVKVGVLLPLKDTAGRGTVMVEFYRGVLMAIDAARNEGINVDCYAADCGNTAEQMEALLKEPEWAKLNVIFGPLEGRQVPPLSEFCRQHSIRMVVPFNTPCPQVYSNPWIFQVGVSQELLFPNITNLVAEHLGRRNFVFCQTGDTDERGQSFTNHLDQVLRLRDMQTTQLALTADEFAYDRALNQFLENVIVPDSRSQESLTRLLTSLKAYLATRPQYRISLLGYPEWLTYTSTLLHDYYKFDTYVFSSYYRNPLSGRTAKFEQQYLQNFSQPSRNQYPRAELLGYDLGQYFILGLATFGSDFNERQGTLSLQPVQHGFNFQRASQQGGYINTFVQLVHYSTNNTIQTLK